MTDCPIRPDRLAELAATLETHDELEARDQALRDHVASCAACRAALARQIIVERALRAWPLAHLPHSLVGPVMARLDDRSTLPEWRWLPWSLWMPAMAIAIALSWALASSMAGQPLPATPLASTESLALVQQQPLTLLAEPLGSAGRELFWAMWSGLFATLAGLGICLGLTSDQHVLTDVAEEVDKRWQHLLQAVRQ